MKPLYTPEEYKQAPRVGKLPFSCECCNKTYYIVKSAINYLKDNNMGNYCSRRCYVIINIPRIITECKHCGKTISKMPCQIKRSKYSFCNRSCSMKYYSTHKTYGHCRSKLEIYISEQLIKLYPSLEIICNGKETINSELDFYIPSLKLAFELNGIIHYEPIFGAEKLKYTLNNDNRKFQACLERGIELCIIDSSKHKYFKLKYMEPYLKMITNIIDNKLIEHRSEVDSN